MLTGLLIFFPLAAALLLLLFKGESVKKIALTASIVEAAITVYVVSQFQINSQPQFLLDYWWIKDLGISFKAGIDGISLLLAILTNLLTPLIIYSSFNHNYKNPTLFYSLILFMQMALIGVFVALDGFLFYMFWELALIPIYFICLLWGGENRLKVTFKFFVYTLSGSLLMLIAFIYLYFQTPGNHSFDINELYNLALTEPAQSLVFWAFFLAFAIKMPIFPFHTWQPDTYVVAPTQGTMLLSGIMLKMGIYGVIRWMIPVIPLAMQEWSNTAIILSIIGIVYASCIAIVQQDYKRLIAYSSIAHVGLIAAGVFSLNEYGLQGAMIQMLSHGINVFGLFFAADIISRHTQTREIALLGGIRNIAPQFATFFIIIVLGSVALPLTNGFVGEFMLLNGVYQFNSVMGGIGGLTIILGAIYMLTSYQKVVLGESSNLVLTTFKEINQNEKIILGIVVALIIAIGVYPKPILELTEPAVKNLLKIAANRHF
jgi:NADH-quinone oxidoreductase subunit M